jgi:hypothetical protein
MVALSVQCLTTDWTTRIRSPADAKDFPLVSVSIPALRPTHPPTQWVPGPFSEIERGQGITLTTHSHSVPRKRMRRSYTSSPPWRLHGGSDTALLYFTLLPECRLVLSMHWPMLRVTFLFCVDKTDR